MCIVNPYSKLTHSTYVKGRTFPPNFITKSMCIINIYWLIIVEETEMMEIKSISNKYNIIIKENLNHWESFFCWLSPSFPIRSGMCKWMWHDLYPSCQDMTAANMANKIYYTNFCFKIFFWLISTSSQLLKKKIKNSKRIKKKNDRVARL